MPDVVEALIEERRQNRCGPSVCPAKSIPNDYLPVSMAVRFSPSFIRATAASKPGLSLVLPSSAVLTKSLPLKVGIRVNSRNGYAVLPGRGIAHVLQTTQNAFKTLNDWY